MLTREEYRKRKERILYTKLATILVLGLAIVVVLLMIILG